MKRMSQRQSAEWRWICAVNMTHFKPKAFISLEILDHFNILKINLVNVNWLPFQTFLSNGQTRTGMLFRINTLEFLKNISML
jgi:hypothetical protein